MENATTKLLDAVKVAHRLTSDYQLAKLLNVRPSAISGYRKGVSQFDDAIACRVADLLSTPRWLVLARLQSERTKSPDARGAWSELLRKIGGKAAAVLLAAMLAWMGGPTPPAARAAIEHNANVRADQPAQDVTVLHIVRRWLARAGRAIRRLFSLPGRALR